MASTGWKSRSLLESNRQVRSFRELASWQSPSLKDRMPSRDSASLPGFPGRESLPKDRGRHSGHSGAGASTQVWGFQAVGSNGKTLFASSSRARSICSLGRKSGAGVGSEGE